MFYNIIIISNSFNWTTNATCVPCERDTYHTAMFTMSSVTQGLLLNFAEHNDPLFKTNKTDLAYTFSKEQEELNVVLLMATPNLID